MERHQPSEVMRVSRTNSEVVYVSVTGSGRPAGCLSVLRGGVNPRDVWDDIVSR